MRLYTKRQVEAIRWMDRELQRLDKGLLRDCQIGGVGTPAEIELRILEKYKEAVSQEILSTGVEVPDKEAKEFLLKYVKRDKRGLHDAW